MSAAGRRISVAITRVSFDLVCDATTDTGVAKLTGGGAVLDTGEEIGPIDLTIWGSTTAQLKMRARTWPNRFDAVQDDHFGVGEAGRNHFDIFLAGERFFRLLDLAHGSRSAVIRLTCERSADGTLDLLREMEISASRG